MLALDKLLPAVVAAICLVALVRLFLSAALRRRFDSALQRIWRRSAGAVQRTVRRVVQRVRHRPMSKKEAARLAQDAIERARRKQRRDAGQADGQWDGNVYRPKSFKGPRKPH